MLQVTEQARETFKEKIEHMADPAVSLRIGPIESGLGVFPDTRQDDDQVIEHEGRALLLIDQAVSAALTDKTIDVEQHADGAHFVIR